MNSPKKQVRYSLLVPIAAAAAVFLASFVLILVYAARTAVPPEPAPLYPSARAALEQTIARKLPPPAAYSPVYTGEAGFAEEAGTGQDSRQRVPGVRALPYAVSPVSLDIGAEAAIIIDAATGCILYEKNADMRIPPASMTKLAVMYVVFQEIERGTLHLNDIIALPPESWAVNAPARSSLMFLGEGQIVTAEELLFGLAVASGNDAAVALAVHISGTQEAFCRRMTEEMRALGLTVTAFVEPSGYSELNITTAREFASFSRMYVQKYPEALKKFHSAEVLVYPQKKNMPDSRYSQPAIVQYSTNKLPGTLEGCDGLKTGYIDESGYNLSLTAERNGTRFISVTMGGPGKNTYEGTRRRNADGTALMEWAFSAFTTVRSEEKAEKTVKVVKGTENSVRLVEAWPDTLTAPVPYAASVTRTLEAPAELTAPVQSAEIYGKVIYEAEGYVLQEIPLVADRSVAKGSFLKVCMDTIARPFTRLFITD